MSDPTSDDRFGMEIVDRTFEESLHLRSVKVNGDDMLDTSNVHEIGKHARRDSTSVRLLLRLSAVGEVWQNGCRGVRMLQCFLVVRFVPVILFAEPPLQAEIKIKSSIMLSLILLLPD